TAGFFQGHDERFLVILVAIDDHQVLVKDRRAAKAVWRVESSWCHHVFAIAIIIITSHTNKGLIQKRDPNTLAVGNRCGAGVAVELMFGFEFRSENSLLPDD